MDPDRALFEIRELIKDINRAEEPSDDAARLAGLVEGLDDWITAGGFLPDSWDHSADDDELEPELEEQDSV